MQFGDRLKSLRSHMGFTQRELGDKLGISSRAIGYYESNERFPKDAHTLTAIADYFGVSLNYLLGKDLPPRMSYNEFLEVAKIHFRLGKPAEQDTIFKDLSNIHYECKKRAL